MHKLFENSGWLLLDKLSKLFPGIIVLALIARHLGPQEFGIWNYGLALTLIVGSLAMMGTDKIAVKEFIHQEQREDVIVNTLVGMRLVAGLVCMLISMGFVLLTKRNNPLYFYCTLFSSLNVVLQSFDVLDYFYQVKHTVKQVILPKVTVFLLFCIIKLAVIFLDGTLLAFLWVSLLELVVTYGVIMIRYRRSLPAIKKLRIDLALAGTLLTEGWPLIFSNLVVVLLVKVDLVLLDALASPAQVGEYVSAAKISELWYALPTVISVAMLPGLMTKRNSDRKAYVEMVEKWQRLSFWTSVAIAAGVMCTAPVIVPFLYGSRYAAASHILMIHIWASVPVFLNAVFVQYMFIEGQYKMYLYSNVAGLIVNVVVNLVLIPVMGGVGAAIATVVAYATVSGILVLLDGTRQLPVFTRRMFSPVLVLDDLRQLSGSFRLFTGQFFT